MPSSSTKTTSTTLHLSSLTLPLTLRHDAWSRPRKPQPVSISLRLILPSVPAACNTDEISGTFSYSTVYSAVTAEFAGDDGNIDGGLEIVAKRIARLASGDNMPGNVWPAKPLSVEIVAPKGVLRAGDGDAGEGLVFNCTFNLCFAPELTWHGRREGWEIRGLRLTCVIGVNEHERLGKQSLVLDLIVMFGGDGVPIRWPGGNDGKEEGFWQGLVRRIGEAVEESTFLTVERLANVVGEMVCNEARGGVVDDEEDSGAEGEGFVDEARVRVKKLEAYALAGSVGCEVVVKNSKGS